MSSDDTSEERPELDLPEEEDLLDEWWGWGNFARLFIFPLIIVLVAVSIYGVFQMMLRDRTSINEHVTKMQTGPENERWRAAYSLAQSVRRREAQKELTRSSVDAIVNLYEMAETPKMREYLALVLAEVPIVKSVEALEKGLTVENTGVKVNSALALGKLYEKADEGPVQQRVRESAPRIVKLLDDENMEVRRMAAFVLGSLENDSVVEDLKTTLNDSASEVRWNGAIALGRLGSEAGVGILIDVLEQESDGNLDEMEPGPRRNLIKNAIDALASLQSERALSHLQTIKENHADSKIRRAALEAIETIKSGKSGG